MKIETFELERTQSLWENRVKHNLTESGLLPYTLTELLGEKEIAKLFSIRIGYGQTNGSIELRETISRLYPGTDLDNVIVTNGAAEANFILTWSLLAPGDELILIVPNYMQIWGIAHSNGVSVKTFPLREELNWGPDIEELKRLVSQKTKIISVCNPNNPTGAIMSQHDMEEIIRIAREVDAWVHADEIYRGSELNGIESPSFSGLYEKVIISSGLSKAYALPGLRIGWLVGPKDIIEKAWKYHDYTSITAGILSHYIATVVLQPEMRKKVLSRSRKILNENLEEVKTFVKKHQDLFNFIPPRAGGMAFMRYNLEINSTELCTKLREEKNVFIIPGDCFRMDHYIRLGIGNEKEEFITGLNLISEFLQEIKGIK
ncbi:MAG: aminotransferase class I/II-fold pyridoxal phosphate-dependent enzyme [Acidobacteriota bacterium]|nr:aminotransferase class I/II-fold pyridoxal phosphate-dependent enzyme [Acidobacteriota bacterium]